MTHGNHGLKFGGDVKFTKDDIDNLRTEFGAYSYNNVQDLITDYTFATDPTFTDPSQANVNLKGKAIRKLQSGVRTCCVYAKDPGRCIVFPGQLAAFPNVYAKPGSAL
jgi:hypothetical protein